MKAGLPESISHQASSAASVNIFILETEVKSGVRFNPLDGFLILFFCKFNAACILTHVQPGGRGKQIKANMFEVCQQQLMFF